MTWEAMSAIGQMLGSIGVFATLVYVAAQLRQNRIAQNIATYESVNQGFNTINGLIAADASLARVMIEGNQHPDSLSPVDQQRYWVTWQSYINQYSQMHSLFESGALSKTLWETHLDALAGSVVLQYRDHVNAPEALWRAVDDYGAPRRTAKLYARASASEEE
jgi:hypothetical protein